MHLLLEDHLQEVLLLDYHCSLQEVMECLQYMIIIASTLAYEDKIRICI